MRPYEIIKKKGDSGTLSVIDNLSGLFGEAKRIFWVQCKHPCIRGKHAHFKTRQLLIPVKGKFRIRLDDGTRVETKFIDEEDNMGVMLHPLVWHEIELHSDDGIFLVLADTEYQESDYIRCYESFLQLVA